MLLYCTFKNDENDKFYILLQLKKAITERLDARDKLFLKRWVIFIYDTVNIYNWHNWAVTRQHGCQLQTRTQSYWWIQFNYYLESGTKLVKLISEEAGKEDSAHYSVIVSKHRLFEQEPYVLKALASLMTERRPAELKTGQSSCTPRILSALQSCSHDICLPWSFHNACCQRESKKSHLYANEKV